MPRYRNSLNVDKDNKDPNMTRRTFLSLLGVGALVGAGHLVGASLVGFLYPNALKTPPSVFSIGRPKDVFASEGRVFNPKQKCFIIVRSGKVRVQTAVCTHLGCTVNAVETGFSCPCHGSTYDLEGLNIGGPAPSPLVYFQVFRGASGELMVDKSRAINNPAAAWYTETA
jgi:cytochrome b6-f complex iron-sulfur subunit